jgi:hypothetical protein
MNAADQQEGRRVNDHEPRVPVECAVWNCKAALYVDARHQDNVRDAGWLCTAHRPNDPTDAFRKGTQ